MERYRRGKAHRAQTGSVNVLSGAPFGYRYVRKNAAHRRRLRDRRARGRPGRRAVPPLHRRRRLDRRAGPLADRRTACPPAPASPAGTARVIWGMLRNPAYAGQAVFGKTKVVHESPGLNRVARLQGRTTPRPSKTVDRPRDEVESTSRCRPSSAEDTFERAAQRLADNKRFASRNSQGPLPAAGPGRLLGLRIRLLPHLHPHHQQEDLLLPVPGQRRLPLRRRPGLRQQAGPRRLPRPRSSGTTSPPCSPNPDLIRAEIDKRLDTARAQRPRRPRTPAPGQRPDQGQQPRSPA